MASLTPIHGIDCHQDLKDHGWAMSPADHDRDLQIILDMGVTAVRLAHYPQSEYFHTLCDRAGILLWNEVSFVNRVPDPAENPAALSATTRAFRANLEEQLRELILQPRRRGGLLWGLFNELGTGTTDAVALPFVRRLNEIAHGLDPNRITVAAANHNKNQPNFVADRTCYNIYPGWYSTLRKGGRRGSWSTSATPSSTTGSPSANTAPDPTRPSIRKPSPRRRPMAPAASEEWQSYVHERDWAQIRNNPKLWGSFSGSCLTPRARAGAKAASRALTTRGWSPRTGRSGRTPTSSIKPIGATGRWSM